VGSGGRGRTRQPPMGATVAKRGCAGGIHKSGGLAGPGQLRWRGPRLRGGPRTGLPYLQRRKSKSSAHIFHKRALRSGFCTTLPTPRYIIYFHNVGSNFYNYYRWRVVFAGILAQTSRRLHPFNYNLSRPQRIFRLNPLQYIFRYIFMFTSIADCCYAPNPPAIRHINLYNVTYVNNLPICVYHNGIFLAIFPLIVIPDVATHRMGE